MRQLDSLTVHDIVEMDPPTILVLKRKDLKRCNALIELMVLSVNEEVNVTQRLSEKAIGFISDSIMNFHDTLTIHDLNLALNKVRAKKLYGVINVNDIMDEVVNIGEEKELAFKDKLYKDNHTTATGINATSKEAQKYIDQIYKKIDAKEKKDRESKPVIKTKPKDPFEIYYDAFLHQVLSLGNFDYKDIAIKCSMAENTANRCVNMCMKYTYGKPGETNFRGFYSDATMDKDLRMQLFKSWQRSIGYEPR